MTFVDIFFDHLLLFSRIQPLNTQPIDLPIVQQNNQRNLTFRSVLIESLRRQSAKCAAYERYFIEKYNCNLRDWLKKKSKENSEKNTTKLRSFFKSQFQELKKEDDSINIEKLKVAIKNEAHLPVMYDSKTRKPPPSFDDRNGLLKNPLQVLKESAMQVSVWTEEEKAVFRKMYLQKPKNFGFIASFLDGKSVSDCVTYYYSSKKKEGYKEQVLQRKRLVALSRAKKTKLRKRKSVNISKIC